MNITSQQLITACAFIHHNFDGTEKVFLPKRAMTKELFPDVYELPGGHIEFGEDIVEGLKREIKEEFAMEISVGDPFYVFTYINEHKNAQSVEIVYFAQFISPISQIQLDSKDHSEYIWIGETEISQIVSEKKGENDEEIKAIRKGFFILKN